MNWFEALNDKRNLEAIYGSEIPDLKAIYVHEIILDGNGPSLKIRFDFGIFPKNPPAKWVQSGLNTVQCVLVIDRIANVKISGWSTKNIGDLTIIQSGSGKFEVNFNNAQTKLSVECELVWIQKVSAYSNG